MGFSRPTVFNTELPDGNKQFLIHHFFKEEGDVIPMHVHPYWHSCCCVSGKVEVEMEDGTKSTLEAGKWSGLPPDIKHSLKALEPGTVTIHVNEFNRI